MSERETSYAQDEVLLLGFTVEDVVTGMVGVVVSVSFDLSGCVQGYVMPRRGEGEKQPEGAWFDTKRLRKVSELPVALRVIARASAENVRGPERLPAPPSKAAP